jgi:hypothetical protein
MEAVERDSGSDQKFVSQVEGQLLREVLEQKIKNVENVYGVGHKALEVLIDSQFLAFDKAIEVAKVELAKTLYTIDEINRALSDANKTFATKLENTKDHDRFEEAVKILTELKSDKVTNTKDHDRMDLTITELVKYKAKMDGMATQESVNVISQRSLVGILLGILALVLSVVLKFF